jgi:hypothetical protein
MTIAVMVIGCNLGISLLCWWLVWKLYHWNCYLAVFNQRTIDRTQQWETQLIDTRHRLMFVSDQLENIQKIYNLRSQQLEGLRQLLYLTGLATSIGRSPKPKRELIR